MRVVLRFLAVLIVGLAIAWLGLWWYAQGRMADGFARWADGMATGGGAVSYDRLKRGTSPFAAEITLTNLVINFPPSSGAAGGTRVVTLPSFALRIGVLNPLLLYIDLPSRITVSVNGLAAVFATQSVAATETLDPHILTRHEDDPFRGGTFNAAGLDLLASSGSLLVLHVDQIRGRYDVNPAAGARDAALDEFLVFNGVALSPLLTHMLSIPFDGRVTQIGCTLRLSGPDPADLAALGRQADALPPTDIADRQKLAVPVLRHWAAAGGNAHGVLSATVGPANLNVAANIGFDANVQPEGTADVSADHLDTVTAALLNAYPQAQGDVAALEARLSPYLTSSAAQGQALAIHAVFGAGQVTVNGKPGFTLPRVDWDALENPPTP